MRTETEIVAAMRAAAQPGRLRLSRQVTAQLRGQTDELAAARPASAQEYARFLAIGRRGMVLPEAELAGRIRHATILVTGGTGCIGTELIRQLAERRSGLGCLVSVSRGITSGYPRHPEVRYRHADICDRAAMNELMAEIRPDLVFHVAGQRDPGLAETEVHRTVTTNVLGTRAVLVAAVRAGVPQVVCCSTGKALRPYSPDVYTASKRAAEWVASGVAAATPMLVSASRFTHVMDNSIICRKLWRWAEAGRAMRLHDPGIAFYVQSARESAQLLLLAVLEARRGEFRVNALTDLGWPVSLLDVALGTRAAAGPESPVYFSGYDRGYEETPFPGLYDPLTAGGVSPLLNMFEAAAKTGWAEGQADTFRLGFAPDRQALKRLAVLAEVCGSTTNPGLARGCLDELSWALLSAATRAVPPALLARSAKMARQQEPLSDVHRRVLEVIESATGVFG